MFSTKSTDVNNRYETSSAYCSNCGSFIGPDAFFCQSCGSKVRPKVAVPSDSRLETFKGYIQVIGIVEIVFGIIALFAALLVTFFVPFLFYLLEDEIAAELATELPAHVSVNVVALVSFLVFGIGLMLFIFGFASIISGRKLLQYQNSGRVGTIVIGVLNLFNFPLGTLFGLAALYVLLQPEVEQLYTKK